VAAFFPLCGVAVALRLVSTKTIYTLCGRFLSSDDAEVVCEPRAPDVVQPLQSVSAKDGDNVQFQCTIVGNPQPDVLWFHAGKPVKLSGEFRAVQDSSSGVCCLDIREVFPEDTGRYTVVARNCFGSATSSADLSVRENETLRGVLHEFH